MRKTLNYQKPILSKILGIYPDAFTVKAARPEGYLADFGTLMAFLAYKGRSRSKGLCTYLAENYPHTSAQRGSRYGP